jgi:O-antigen/teichoic acid export membrane protein
MFHNSLALIVGTGATLALGFLTWLIAARLFAPAQVGLASGVVSAMMLCVQVALLGIGAAIITLLPEHHRRPSHLLSTAFSVVAGAALLTAGVFLLLASGFFHELRVVASTPTYSATFLAMGVLGTLALLYDQTSIAVRRGDQVMTRGVVQGVVRLVLIGMLPFVARAANFPLVARATTSLAIFSCWLVGSAAACLLGFVQLRRALPQCHYRPRMEPRMVRRLLSVGLPNHGLTLADRAPGLIMPVIATELLSPTANAYWYAVWMMAFLVFVVPSSIGMVLFAEAANRPAAIGHAVRQSLRLSLGIGVVVATGVAALAPFMLSMLGHRYAAAGATPLRILVLAILPLTFIQAYYGACRATQRLPEALCTGAVSGALSIAVAAMAGPAYGLRGMAAAWLGAQLVTGAWAGWRLWRVSRNAWGRATTASVVPSFGTTAECGYESTPMARWRG